MGVYKDYDAAGQPVIACLICGNRFPGGKEGFYMSGGVNQTEKEKKDGTGSIGEITHTPRKLCATCGNKPTISDSSPYCPSCMNKRSRESQKNKTASVRLQREKPKKDTTRYEKTPTIENTAVNIDFGEHPLILKRVRDLADQEIRPLELQIIYLLKRHFDNERALPKEV